MIPIEYIFKILWLAQGGFLLGLIAFIILSGKKMLNFWYKILLASSYFILTFIDVYTIVFEDYPIFSVKSFSMLIAFIIGDIGIWLMIGKKE